MWIVIAIGAIVFVFVFAIAPCILAGRMDDAMELQEWQRKDDE